MSRGDGYKPIPEAEVSPAQKERVRLPSSKDELEKATSNVSFEVGYDLDFQSHEGTTLAHEEWDDVTLGLEKLFFEIKDGQKAQELLILAAESAETLAQEPARGQAITLLRETAPFAHRLRPLVERIAHLLRGGSKEEVLANLISGRPEDTEDGGEMEACLTLFGALQTLGNKLGDAPEARLWMLEAVELPSAIVLRNPFSLEDGVQAYWRVRIKAAKEARPNEPEPTIFSLSGHKTEALIGDLELWRETLENDPEQKDLANALQRIEEWLEKKLVYYRDGSPADVAAYRLKEGGEFLSVIKDLDLVKQKDPERFLEMCGMTAEGEKSSGFGTFLHATLYNTQDHVHKSKTGAAIEGMITQLLTTDQPITFFEGAGAFTPEQFRAMAEQGAGIIKQAPPEGAATVAAMVVGALMRPAMAAEVTRQLEAMQNGGEQEKEKKRLLELLADVEHPMLLLEYLGNASLSLFDDPEVQTALWPIFGKISADNQSPHFVDTPARLKEACRQENPSTVRAVFNRLPLFDATAGTFGPYLKTVWREVNARGSYFGKTKEQFMRQVNPKMRAITPEVLADYIVTTEPPWVKLSPDEQREAAPKIKQKLIDQYGDMLDVVQNPSTITTREMQKEDRDFYLAQVFAYKNRTGSFDSPAAVRGVFSDADMNAIFLALTVLNRPVAVKRALQDLTDLKSNLSEEVREKIVRSAFKGDVKFSEQAPGEKPLIGDKRIGPERRKRAEVFWEQVYRHGLLTEMDALRLMLDLEGAKIGGRVGTMGELANYLIRRPSVALSLMRAAGQRDRRHSAIDNFMMNDLQLPDDWLPRLADVDASESTSYMLSYAKLPKFSDVLVDRFDTVLARSEYCQLFLREADNGIDMRLVVKAAENLTKLQEEADAKVSYAAEFQSTADRIANTATNFFYKHCSEKQWEFLKILARTAETHRALVKVAKYFEDKKIQRRYSAYDPKSVPEREMDRDAMVWQLLWGSIDTEEAQEKVVAHLFLEELQDEQRTRVDFYAKEEISLIGDDFDSESAQPEPAREEIYDRSYRSPQEYEQHLRVILAASRAVVNNPPIGKDVVTFMKKFDAYFDAQDIKNMQNIAEGNFHKDILGLKKK